MNGMLKDEKPKQVWLPKKTWKYLDKKKLVPNEPYYSVINREMGIEGRK